MLVISFYVHLAASEKYLLLTTYSDSSCTTLANRGISTLVYFDECIKYNAFTMRFLRVDESANTATQCAYRIVANGTNPLVYCEAKNLETCRDIDLDTCYTTEDTIFGGSNAKVTLVDIPLTSSGQIDAMVWRSDRFQSNCQNTGTSQKNPSTYNVVDHTYITRNFLPVQYEEAQSLSNADCTEKGSNVFYKARQDISSTIEFCFALQSSAQQCREFDPANNPECGIVDVDGTCNRWSDISGSDLIGSTNFARFDPLVENPQIFDGDDSDENGFMGGSSSTKIWSTLVIVCGFILFSL